MPDHNEYTRKRIKDLFQKDDAELDKSDEKPLTEKKKDKCKTDKRGFRVCPDGKVRWGWGYGWPGSGSKPSDSDSGDSDSGSDGGDTGGTDGGGMSGGDGGGAGGGGE